LAVGDVALSRAAQCRAAVLAAWTEAVVGIRLACVEHRIALARGAGDAVVFRRTDQPAPRPASGGGADVGTAADVAVVAVVIELDVHACAGRLLALVEGARYAIVAIDGRTGDAPGGAALLDAGADEAVVAVRIVRLMRARAGLGVAGIDGAAD